MAGSSNKSPSIPAWQQKRDPNAPPSPAPSDTPAPAASSSVTPSTPTTRETLLKQAALFLEDDGVKDESLERKKQFLEAKGLTGEEIQQLLQEKPAESDESTSTSASNNDLKTIHDSTESPTASSTSSQDATPTPIPLQSTTTDRDVPPIITYPEFLLRSQKPPPLITGQRLFYALEGLAAVAATVYGANKYLVEPMLERMTESRHDLFTTTLERLTKLNEKLEANVSSIPVITSNNNKTEEKDISDTESIASDPTELFHRDIATQTSPSLANSVDISTSTSTFLHDLSPAEVSEKYTSSHTARLNTIRANLTYLESVENPNPTDTRSNAFLNLDSLHSYLDRLDLGYQDNYLASFSKSFDKNSTLGDSTANRTSTNSSKSTEAQEDEIAKIKKEIRGLKGALLSSRNFPMASNTRAR